MTKAEIVAQISRQSGIEKTVVMTLWWNHSWKM